MVSRQPPVWTFHLAPHRFGVLADYGGATLGYETIALNLAAGDVGDTTMAEDHAMLGSRTKRAISDCAEYQTVGVGSGYRIETCGGMGDLLRLAVYSQAQR